MINSAVWSCQIEGNPMGLEAYTDQQIVGTPTSKPGQEIKELIQAYHYARQGPLTEGRLLRAHQYLSRTLLTDAPHQSGAYRRQAVVIRNLKTGQVVYRGAEADAIAQEMGKLLADIGTLTAQALTPTEVFYYAAQLHLWFAQIHPFADGNGRMARLLEKWFLSELLGSVAWHIQSEHYYQRHLVSYYRSLHMGADYSQVTYALCMPFLLLLPWSFRLKDG